MSSHNSAITENLWLNKIVPIKKETSKWPITGFRSLVTDTITICCRVGWMSLSRCRIKCLINWSVIMLILAPLSSKAGLNSSWIRIVMFKSSENWPIFPFEIVESLWWFASLFLFSGECLVWNFAIFTDWWLYLPKYVSGFSSLNRSHYLECGWNCSKSGCCFVGCRY